MDLFKNVSLVWLIYLLYLSNNIHNVVEGGRILSPEEDRELEKHLKRLNKPAVKTIQTEHGDIYGCVDFYSQPAFDHPLLTNHTFHFEMKPSRMPKVTNAKMSSKDNINVSYVKFEELDCPLGTVPLRRVTKDDLIRAKSPSSTFGNENTKLRPNASDSKFGVLTLNTPGTHWAWLDTKVETNTYSGGGARMSVHNPLISASQRTLASVTIIDTFDSIEAGWMVNPHFFHERYETRLFIRTNTYDITSCFNTDYPAFVVVNRNIPLGSILPVSLAGQEPSVLVVYIFKDGPDGNWWLAVGDKRINIGFWPKTIFDGLGDYGKSVTWGGEVFGNTKQPSAPMGNGKFPSAAGDLRRDAFFSNMIIVNESREDSDPGDLVVDLDDSKTYVAGDKGIVKGSGHLMFYGGPGGYVGN